MTFSAIYLHCSAKPVTTWPWVVQCDMGCEDGMQYGYSQEVKWDKSIAFSVSVIKDTGDRDLMPAWDPYKAMPAQ